MKPDQRLKMLEEAPLAGLLVRFSWPALVSMTLSALYSIVDRIYIGQGCGQDAMAGLTLAFPVMMVFGAFGVFAGVGHSAVLSIKLGEGDRATCEKALGELVALKLLFFATLPPLVFAFMDPVMRWSGGAAVTEGALEMAKTYLRIVLFSNLFSHLAFGLSAAMRSEGAVMQSMTCMIVGFGANLVLDPIFIFALDMGVAGAAWATNIAMACSCAFALWHYRPGHSAVRLRLRRIGFYRPILAKACGIGLAPALQQLSGSLVNVSLQLAFAYWAADKDAATAQLASLGIFQMVTMFFVMPLMGVQQGIAPVMGYNWGARNYGRVRQALIVGLWASTAVAAFASAAQVVGAGAIARLFSDGADEGFIRMAAGDLRVSNCMLWCIGLNVVATTYFQSIGRPKTAIVLSLLRQVLCLIPCIWALPCIAAATGLCAPATAIWLAMPASDLLACVATVPPFMAHARFLLRVDARRRVSPGKLPKRQPLRAAQTSSPA